MIQRIQSVYLLVSVVLLSAVFIFPLSETIDITGNIYIQHNNFTYNIKDNNIIFKSVPLVILLVITVFISLFSIFQYKNRKRQIRLCVFNIVLMIGLTGLMYFYYKITPGEIMRISGITISGQHMYFTAICPIIAAFFTYLAFKSILKDEILVKSADRLR